MQADTTARGSVNWLLRRDTGSNDWFPFSNLPPLDTSLMLEWFRGFATVEHANRSGTAAAVRACVRAGPDTHPFLSSCLLARPTTVKAWTRELWQLLRIRSHHGDGGVGNGHGDALAFHIYHEEPITCQHSRYWWQMQKGLRYMPVPVACHRCDCTADKLNAHPGPLVVRAGAREQSKLFVQACAALNLSHSHGNRQCKSSHTDTGASNHMTHSKRLLWPHHA